MGVAGRDTEPLSRAMDVEKQPLASEVAARLEEIRRHPVADLRLIIPVVIAVYAINEMGTIKLFHKVLPLLPLVVGIALASLPSAMRRGIRLPVLLSCFVVFTVASYTWTTDRFGVIRHDIEFVAVAAAGWLVGAVFDRETLCRIFAIAMRVFIVVTIASLVFAHHWATVPAVDGAPGWHGPFGHKNGLGLEMAIGLIALWYERPHTRSR